MSIDPILGSIGIFAGNFAPRGWAKCEGQLLPIASNSALFSLLGTTYGGDGRTTFALPDLRGRIPKGYGNGLGLAPVTLGEKGGKEHTVLSITNLPPHTHNTKVAVKNGIGELTSPVNGIIANEERGFAEDATPNAFLGGVKEDTVGNETPVDIRNSYLGMNYCIALEGVFPSRS